MQPKEEEPEEFDDGQIVTDSDQGEEEEFEEGLEEGEFEGEFEGEGLEEGLEEGGEEGDEEAGFDEIDEEMVGRGPRIPVEAHETGRRILIQTWTKQELMRPLLRQTLSYLR